jgi:hypothetical protein
MNCETLNEFSVRGVLTLKSCGLKLQISGGIVLKLKLSSGNIFMVILMITHLCVLLFFACFPTMLYKTVLVCFLTDLPSTHLRVIVLIE